MRESMTAEGRREMTIWLNPEFGGAAVPHDLAAFLRDIGMDAPKPLEPLDAEAMRAVRHGISAQWRPQYPGEEPPF
jgi:hypothetical protein